MSKVLILPASYEEIGSAVERTFQELPLAIKGKKVLVKPNILGPFTPDKGVTTHPTLVKAVVEILLEKGAQVVVGDNSGNRGYGANVQSAKDSGIFDASLGRYVNLAIKTKKILLPESVVGEVIVSKEVLKADLVISLPKFKTHTLTKITGAIKNIYGILPGGQKTCIHGLATSLASFSESLVDIFQIRPPDLTIMDAVVGMEGQGPSNGRLRHIGKVMASIDAVALDACLAYMMGWEPSRVDHISIAYQRGLGEMDLSRIEVVGELSRLRRFKKPPAVVPRYFGPLAGWISNFFVGEPRLIQERCNKCGQCAEICPVETIEMGDYPVFNREKCIYCYCCQEICPEGALEIRTKFLRK